MTEIELLELIERAAEEEWEELDLSDNELTELPPEIGKLTKLKRLILGKYDKKQKKFFGNKLTSLPAEIGQLRDLKELRIGGNQLRQTPAEIGQLSNLRTLYLNVNQLSQLPAEIGQLSNLQSLSFAGNQLSQLPAEIVQLSNLQSLNLANTQLSQLPAEIGQLSNLQTLYLRSNQLSQLPPEIGQLSNLQILYLNFNQLSQLPAEIGQLSNLRTFDLRANQLSQLPAEIRQLSQLKQLDLRSNPLPIPPEILGPKISWQDPGNVNEILDFYFRVQDPNETESFYEAKFLIVGEGGAGKTSLAEKIRDENYELKPDEHSTEGIDVIHWEFPLPDGNLFRVNIWDFGGQAIYHQTHQFFLTERSLYALVVDTRQRKHRPQLVAKSGGVIER